MKLYNKCKEHSHLVLEVHAWFSSFIIGLISGVILVVMRSMDEEVATILRHISTFIIMYLCACFTTLALIIPLWQEVREHCPLGLLAGSFWVSGTISVAVSFCLNNIMMGLWAYLSPDNYALSPNQLFESESIISSLQC